MTNIIRVSGVLVGILHILFPVLGLYFNVDYMYVGHEVSGREFLWISYLSILGLLLVIPYSKVDKYFKLLFTALVIFVLPELCFFLYGVGLNILNNKISLVVTFGILVTILISNITVIWKSRPEI